MSLAPEFDAFKKNFFRIMFLFVDSLMLLVIDFIYLICPCFPSAFNLFKTTGLFCLSLFETGVLGSLAGLRLAKGNLESHLPAYSS